MPTYKAKEVGYHDDIIRKEGQVFASTRRYNTDGKSKELAPLPSWLLLVDVSSDEAKNAETGLDRSVAMTNAIKEMMKEDPNAENTDFWIGNGAPDVKELQKRTDLADITANERNALWNKVKLPSSGKTPIA